MDNIASASPSRANRITAGLRLIYAELQYWLIGLTPESYHSAKASAWEDLGNFKRAAKHLAAFLESSENSQIRALLAYCYSQMECWSDAAREYTTVIAIWPHPSFVLGLAEARFHLGDVAQARELTASVESSSTALEPFVEQALAFMKAQLAAASQPLDGIQLPQPGVNT